MILIYRSHHKIITTRLFSNNMVEHLTFSINIIPIIHIIIIIIIIIIFINLNFH